MVKLEKLGHLHLVYHFTIPLNLIYTAIKPVVCYACKSWGDPKYQHNLSEIEKFHLSLCK